MCRLLGVVAATNARIADLVPDELPRLEALAAIHPHGWGIAWGAGHGVAVAKAPERAGTTERWREGTARRSDAALLHIRQASPGMPHVLANTHPFLADGMAFAHNGHASPTSALDALVVDATAPGATGDTDSERYWSLVRAAARHRPLGEALLDAAARVAAATTATSLNALVLGDDALVAVAWWDEPAIRRAGDGETERDYRLWYRAWPDRVVVASADVAGDDADWQELPHGCSLTVDRRSLSLSLRHRATPRPA